MNEGSKLRIFTPARLGQIPQLEGLPRERLEEMKAVSAVLPFRVNQYVCDELIDWSRIPDDPIYQLTFPQRGMLAEDDLHRMLALVRDGADAATLSRAARPIQLRLNPHPAGQHEHNVPVIDGERLHGAQHKYRETVLFFPTQGQTCHSYCTYCFRWAQFAGLDGLKFQNKEPELLCRYVQAHPEVKSVLITGGDPLVMKTRVLRRYIEPLLAVPHLQSIRLGTKAVAYWPHRFVSDDDADDLLRLFEDVIAAGKTLAVMGHYSHPRELSTPMAEAAVARIRSTGAVLRCQAPLIKHVNDDAAIWAELWNRQVTLGAVPYYMFVERDTGARHYFEVPLARALEIFEGAFGQVSGLGRTVRGPSMSASPGKVLIDGVTEIKGEKVFVLKIVQARVPAWVGRVFFARFDPDACWLRDLRPALGQSEFFYEPELARLLEGKQRSLLEVLPSRVDEAAAGY